MSLKHSASPARHATCCPLSLPHASSVSLLYAAEPLFPCALQFSRQLSHANIPLLQTAHEAKHAPMLPSVHCLLFLFWEVELAGIDCTRLIRLVLRKGPHMAEVQAEQCHRHHRSDRETGCRQLDGRGFRLRRRQVDRLVGVETSLRRIGIIPSNRSPLIEPPRPLTE